MKHLLLLFALFSLSFSAFAQFEAGEYVNSDTLKNKGVDVFVEHLKLKPEDIGKVPIHQGNTVQWTDFMRDSVNYLDLSFGCSGDTVVNSGETFILFDAPYNSSFEKIEVIAYVRRVSDNAVIDYVVSDVSNFGFKISVWEDSIFVGYVAFPRTVGESDIDSLLGSHLTEYAQLTDFDTLSHDFLKNKNANQNYLHVTQNDTASINQFVRDSSNYVTYTGNDRDLDMGAYKVTAQTAKITGLAGVGTRLGTVASDGTVGAGTLHDLGIAPAVVGGYLPLSGGGMSNTNLVTNLNADLLDGLHKESFMSYRGSWGTGDFQDFQSTPYTVRFDQVGDITNFDNYPLGCYTYGGLLSLKGEHIGVQLYASHYGDLVYKTQWNNDNYSGWRHIWHSANSNISTVNWAANILSANSIKLATGATIDYIWKCTGSDGSGAWTSTANYFIGGSRYAGNDLDFFNSCGAGYYLPTDQNIPFPNYGTIFNIDGYGTGTGSGWNTQLAFSTANDDFAIRSSINSNTAWTTWKNIFHSGNSNLSTVNWTANTLTSDALSGTGTRLVAATSDGTLTPSIAKQSGDTLTVVNTIKKGIENSTVSGVVFTQTANQTVANTTTETTMFGSGVGSLTFPANFFTAGKTVRVKIKGFLSAQNGEIATLKIKLNDSIMVNSAGTFVSLTDVGADIEFDLTCRTTGTTGTVIGQGFSTVSGGQGFSTSTVRSLQMLTTKTINTTVAQTINFTYQWNSANTGNSITTTNASVEVLN